MSFKNLTARDLLKQYDEILEELRARDVVRNSNPPAGGYAEYLVSKALNLKLENNSNAGFDAIDNEGRCYEIKGRRNTVHNNSRQLSSIRNIENKHFDFLVGVIFSSDFAVLKACIMPHDLVVAKAKYKAHTNSSILVLNDSIWHCEGVVDITDVLIKTQNLV